MDDAAFQKWSDKLNDLRRSRQAFIDAQAGQLADSFSAAQFYELCQKSLEDIMSAWFGFEQLAWVEQTPPDVPAAQETLRNEMESILDFELEALERDKTSLEGKVSWDPKTVEKPENDFKAFAEEIRKKYQVKINNLSGGQKKSAPAEKPGSTAATPAPVAATRMSRGGSGGGSGLGLFLMFFVGLLFGGAPSFYYMDAAKHVESKFQDERKKLVEDKRSLEDSVAVLHENFDQLALGKMSNIPDLEREMASLEAANVQEQHRIEADYQRERERMIKRLAAGERQDQAILELEKKRDAQIDASKTKLKTAEDPLIKQRDLLKSLLNR